MKPFLSKYLESYKKWSFLQGVTLTLCLSSLISIAATNFPGFTIFTPGTLISAEEINNNFEKVVGKIVVKANVSSSFSGDNSSFYTPSDCPTCHVFRKKINFDVITVNDSNLKTGIDPETSSSTYNSDFSYYQVPSSGWYEIRFTPSAAVDFTNTQCTAGGCSVNVYANFSLLIANSLSAINSAVYSLSFQGGSSKYQSDSGGTPGTFNAATTYPSMPPEIKRIYLKMDQLLFVKFEANYSQNYATADYSFAVAPNSTELTIIKL
ncbi:MAG: hypothetical protein KBD76_07705 [Bacteriovorax sp.]|jgi:hypothetical protein|nr:hypothetical protein [Bacteriovorax sp.]